MTSPDDAFSPALRKRREARARMAVGVGLTAAVGLTVVALITAQHPAQTVTAKTGATATVGGAGFTPSAAPAPATP